MKAYQNLQLCLLLFVMMVSCGKSQSDVTEAEAPPATIKEREVLPTPHPASIRLEEVELDVPWSDNIEAVITEIREQYAAITSKLELEILRKEIEGFECEDDPSGRTLTRYYEYLTSLAKNTRRCPVIPQMKTGNASC